MSKSLTFEDWLRRSREKHGDKFDYSNVEFVAARSHVKIVCPIHGEFSQSMKEHVISKYGCRGCHEVARQTTYKTITHDTWLRRFKKHFGETYQYIMPEGRLRGMDDIGVICPEHGIFTSKPDYLKYGHGCPLCANRDRVKSNRKDFHKEAKEVHGIRYIYDKTEYQNTDKPITITCRNHGDFVTTGYQHVMRGIGCPTCGAIRKKRRAMAVGSTISDGHFQRHPELVDIPYKLYVVEMNDEASNFIKVGIAKENNLPKRMTDLKNCCHTITDFSEVLITNLPYYECWKLEQSLLDKYKEFKYKPSKKFGGYTECLNYDTLPLVLEEIETYVEKNDEETRSLDFV